MSLNRPVNIDTDTSDLTMKKALHRSNSRRSSRRHQSVAAVNRAASIKSQNSETLERTSTMPAANLAPASTAYDEVRDVPSRNERVSIQYYASRYKITVIVNASVA